MLATGLLIMLNDELKHMSARITSRSVRNFLLCITVHVLAFLFIVSITFVYERTSVARYVGQIVTCLQFHLDLYKTAVPTR